MSTAIRTRASSSGRLQSRQSVVALAGAGAEVVAARAAAVAAVPATDEATPTLTRASVERLRRECAGLQEQIPKLQAEIDALREALERERSLRKEADNQRELEMLREALEQEKRLRRIAQKEAEEERARRKAAEAEVATAAERAEAQVPCGVCERFQKEAETARAATTQARIDMDEQRVRFEEDMQAVAVKFQRFRSTLGLDSIRKRLVVHIVAPSVWLESQGAPAWLLPGGPGVDTLVRGLESQLLPLCADVICYEDGDLAGAETAQQRADGLIMELVVGLQKHLMEHANQRTGKNGAEENPAARIRVDWGKLPS